MKLSVTQENAGLLLTYAQLNCHFLVQHFGGKHDVYVMNVPILLQQFLRCLSEKGYFFCTCLIYILEIKDQDTNVFHCNKRKLNAANKCAMTRTFL